MKQCMFEGVAYRIIFIMWKCMCIFVFVLNLLEIKHSGVESTCYQEDVCFIWEKKILQ